MEPYTILADYYDRFMEHVPYEDWAEYISEIISEFHPAAKRVLDLSAGTGSFIAHWPENSFDWLAADLILPMIRRCRKKNPGVPALVMEAAQPALRPGRFDTVLFLYDSVHYLLAENEVSGFLLSAHTLLRSGGLLVFDVVTPQACQREFGNYSEIEWFDDIEIQRHSWFETDTKKQYTRLSFNLEKGTGEELHVQQIRTVSEWDRIISGAAFETLGKFDNFTFDPANRRTDRVHYVLKKI